MEKFSKITTFLALLLFLAGAKEAEGYDYLKITSLFAKPSTISQGETSTITVSLKEHVDWGGWWGGIGWTEKPTATVEIAGRILYPELTWSNIGPVGSEWWWMPWPWGPILLYYYQDSWWIFKTVWDGKDKEGNFIPAGEHTYKASAIFSFGMAPPKEGKITVGTPVEFIGYHHKDSKDNDKYDTPLEDHTMLTKKDAIVIKVTTEDPDPSVHNTVELKVYSQSDPTEITIMAKESGNNTGIYYNYNPADGYDPMYDSPLYIDTTRGIDRVRVDDENEVITAYLKDNPNAKDAVKLDLTEVGVGWFQDYGDLCIGSRCFNVGKLGGTWSMIDRCIFWNLVRTKENAEYVYNTLVGREWINSFNNGDKDDCKESQYDEDGDSEIDGVDTVDLAIWAGHGPYGVYPYPLGSISYWSEPALHFYTTLHLDASPFILDDVDLYRSEARWGDDDLDWIGLFTCNFLADPASIISNNQIGNGVRMVCGFKDGMRMLPKEWMAEIFIKLITRKNDPMPIKDAWLEMARFKYIIDPTTGKIDPVRSQTGTGVIIFDTKAANDHLPGFGDYIRGTTFKIDAFKGEK